MAQPVDRLYRGIDDPQMLEGAQTMLDLFISDQAEFAAFDASLDAAFATAMQGRIDAGIDQPTDETVQNEITELTDAMNVAWVACQTHFQDAKYFIEKAFPGNTAKHNQFGFDDYRDMTRDQKKVLQFMDQFSDMAVGNGAVLIGAGYSQPRIDQIATLGNAFRTANRAQEKAKKERPEKTQTRLTAYNAVWEHVQKINRASKTLYRTNYAKLQQYLLPAPGSNEQAEDLSLTGTIFNTATNLPEAGVAVALPALGLTTTSDNEGKYGFTAQVPPGDTTLKATKTGFGALNLTVTILAGELVTRNLQITPGA